jgi:hypothetical protein
MATPFNLRRPSMQVHTTNSITQDTKKSKRRTKRISKRDTQISHQTTSKIVTELPIVTETPKGVEKKEEIHIIKDKLYNIGDSVVELEGHISNTANRLDRHSLVLENIQTFIYDVSQNIYKELHNLKNTTNNIVAEGISQNEDIIHHLSKTDYILKEIQTANETMCKEISHINERNAAIMQDFEKLYTRVNTKEETPTVKMLLSRMDSLESNIDCLNNILLRFLEPPKIQRCVAGSGITSELIENIRFGRIQKATV